MKKLVFSLLFFSPFLTYAQASSNGWEANVTLSTIQDLHAKVPEVLVPKQSIQMTATVWMPENMNWFPQYPQWDMPGATIVPLFMLSPSIERQQGSFTQRGATQNYLLTPLSEGTLTLNQTSLTVNPDEKMSPVLPIAPLNVEVALPPGAGDIGHFLPASGVKLTQSWYLLSADKTTQELSSTELKTLTLKSGQQLERRILIEAQGIQGKLIPALTPDPQSTQSESESTDLMNYDEFIGGTRTEHWYYVPQQKSLMQLSDSRVRWYDTVHQQFRIAKIDGIPLKIEAQAETAPGIQLTVIEKISLLSTGIWQVIFLAIALLAALMIYRRKVGHLFGQLIHTSVEAIKSSSRIQFIWLCVQLLLWGEKKPQSLRHYHQWQLAFYSEQTRSSATLERWLAAAYGSGEQRYPGRLSIIYALFHQPRTDRQERKNRFFAPRGLPEISTEKETLIEKTWGGKGPF